MLGLKPAMCWRENVRAISPGFELPPKYLDLPLGSKVSRIVKAGPPVASDLL